MKRRTFLTAASLSLIASQLPAKIPRSRRAAVIGHTGRGNYGHDVVWQKIPCVEIVGVADADSKGLEKALGRLKIERGFSDYRKMLSELRPEFVSVAPRHPDLIASVHDHTLAIQDLIDAVDDDRDPLCDGRQGAMAVEMTCSVFESHRRNGAWVSFPLTERGNPLSRL